MKTAFPHTFNIPVMGTGFTIDTPLKAARYGITSVISLVDDALIEQMREYHSRTHGEPFEPIESDEDDARARRITAYLNLLDRLIRRQVEKLQQSPFEPGSEITRYYSLLPQGPLKSLYRDMVLCPEGPEKTAAQDILRKSAVPGSIDVNIMTKLDRPGFKKGQPLPLEHSDALAALRGYANSTLRSAIEFSAGMNPRLYGYITQFPDFFPDKTGAFRKEIILKVSDFRSAEIQGRFLAKKGLWVSEYRIESGLNCGGHAFANKGLLMGPVLEDFLQKKIELAERLAEDWTKALSAAGKTVPEHSPDLRVSVQGGIGTAEEHQLLLRQYRVDRTGWGTPFLLVPEVTNVDRAHLEKLCAAQEGDVVLSENSPLGVPFWTLKTSESEHGRLRRIDEGRPGSPCPKGYLAADTEFTRQPICRASITYQRNKLRQLRDQGLPEDQFLRLQEKVTTKACICHDLAGGVTIKYNIDPKAETAVCCGPNIVNFSRIASLEEMVDHIYGRRSLLANPGRPNFFIRELQLYVDYLRKEIEEHSAGIGAHTDKYFDEFGRQLLSGIAYYRDHIAAYGLQQREKFMADLEASRSQVIKLLENHLFAAAPQPVP